jgi:hypothetical protein
MVVIIFKMLFILKCIKIIIFYFFKFVFEISASKKFIILKKFNFLKNIDYSIFQKKKKKTSPRLMTDHDYRDKDSTW